MARPTGTPIQKNSPTKDFSLAAGETTSDSWGLDEGFRKNGVTGDKTDRWEERQASESEKRAKPIWWCWIWGVKND